MRQAVVLDVIASVAKAARRYGLGGRAHWWRRCMKPFVSQLQVAVDDLTFCGTVEHWEFLDRIRRRQFEPETTRCFLEAMRPGVTVVDIGACLGYYACLAARRVSPSGRIFAFEPDPENFQWLMHNIRLNGCSRTITAVPKAVGGRAGSVTLFRHPVDPSQHSVVPPGLARQGVQVDSVTLGAFLEGQAVHMIKLDVEGSELDALRGMKGLLDANPQIHLFVESNHVALRRAGASEQALIHWLQQAGFDITMLDPQRAPDGSILVSNLYCRKRSGQA